jgi:hypothetical protein
MKQTEKFYHVKFFFLTVILIFTVSASNLTFAGSKDSTAKANMAKTIISGINSPNRGLAQRSIYLAGYYGFSWAVDPLINFLNDPSKDPSLRILAAYSLIMSGDEKGIEAVKASSVFEQNQILQGMCRYIYSDYIHSSDGLFTLSK